MSELSILLQARKEIMMEIREEERRPKWDRDGLDKLKTQLDITNNLIAQHVENNTEGERTLF